MKKIKIVQIIPELNLEIMGGIGSFVQTLLCFIDKEQTENIVVTYKSDSEDRRYYENLGIPVFSLLEDTKLPEKTAIETKKWLIQTLKNIQPDIVTTHGFWGTTLGVESAHEAGISVITSIADNIDLNETPQQKREKKRLAKFSDCIVCVSNSVKNYIHQVEEISETKLRVIYDEETFDAKIMAQNYLNLYQELFWQQSAERSMKQGSLNSAISAYRKVLKLNPDSALSYQNLAEIFAQKKWRKEAVNFYFQAWLCNSK